MPVGSTCFFFPSRTVSLGCLTSSMTWGGCGAVWSRYVVLPRGVDDDVSAVRALPGRTSTAILGAGSDPRSTGHRGARIRLDEPLPMRFGIWLGRAVQGDLGVSYRTGEVVTVTLRDRIPTSLELLALTQLTVVGIAGVSPHSSRPAAKAVVSTACSRRCRSSPSPCRSSRSASSC